MSATVIELNDLGIRAFNASQCLHESPGYALVQADGVVVGEFARQQARLNPLHTHYQYWQYLNTDPLATDNPQVRHHGDLVYLQLQELARQIQLTDNQNHPNTTNRNSELILAVPGSFSREQLALILGICQALSLNVIAMVDSAVAATSAHPVAGHHLFIDLQLNQALISEIYIGQQIEQRRTHIIPEQGWQSLIDHLAKFITGEFIRQTRFDPKHAASSEQSLYNQLPEWLRQAQTQKDIKLDIDKQSIQLPQSQLLNQVADFFQPMLGRTSAIWEQQENQHVLYSDRWQQLPSVIAQLSNTHALSPLTLPQNCMENLTQLQTQNSDNVSFTTALQRRASQSADTPLSPRQTAKKTPTHLLHEHHAYPLSDTCYLRDNASSPVTKQANGTSIASIQHGQLAAEGNNTILINQHPLQTSTALTVGDELQVPNSNITLKCICIKELI